MTLAWTHHWVILPELVAFQVMALEHHDRAVEFRHIQAKIISSDLFIGRVGENLSRRKRSQYVNVISAVVVKHHHHYSNSVRVSKRERRERLTWLPPIPWQLKMPTFSFSFLAMLSRHWLVSTLRIWKRTDHTDRLGTVKQLSRMNKHSHVSVSVSNMLNYPKLIAHRGGGRCIDELRDKCANQIHKQAHVHAPDGERDRLLLSSKTLKKSNTHNFIGSVILYN